MISGQQLGGFSLSSILEYNHYLDAMKTTDIKQEIHYAINCASIQMYAIIIYEYKIKICIWDKPENKPFTKRRIIHNILAKTMPIHVHFDVEYMGEN